MLDLLFDHEEASLTITNSVKQCLKLAIDSVDGCTHWPGCQTVTVLVLQIANVYFAVNNVKPFILAGCAYVSMKNLQTTKMVHFSPLAM